MKRSKPTIKIVPSFLISPSPISPTAVSASPPKEDTNLEKYVTLLGGGKANCKQRGEEAGDGE